MSLSPKSFFADFLLTWTKYGEKRATDLQRESRNENGELRGGPTSQSNRYYSFVFLADTFFKQKASSSICVSKNLSDGPKENCAKITTTAFGFFLPSFKYLLY